MEYENPCSSPLMYQSTILKSILHLFSYSIIPLCVDVSSTLYTTYDYLFLLFLCYLYYLYLFFHPLSHHHDWSFCSWMGTFLASAASIDTFFGAVIIKTPSEDKLETTEAILHPLGRVYFLMNFLETCFDPSSAFSSWSASTVRMFWGSTVTLISSGRKLLVSRLSWNCFSSSLREICCSS